MQVNGTIRISNRQEPGSNLQDNIFMTNPQLPHMNIFAEGQLSWSECINQQRRAPTMCQLKYHNQVNIVHHSRDVQLPLDFYASEDGFL